MIVESFPTSASGITDFKNNYRDGVANALNIKATEVTILSASPVSRRDRRRELLSVSVNVVYVVSVPAASSAASLTTSLITAQNNGVLNIALQNNGILGALTSQAVVTNLSPTTSPSLAPMNGSSLVTYDFIFVFTIVISISCVLMLT